jgi:hypothetical protein
MKCIVVRGLLEDRLKEVCSSDGASGLVDVCRFEVAIAAGCRNVTETDMSPWGENCLQVDDRSSGYTAVVANFCSLKDQYGGCDVALGA